MANRRYNSLVFVYIVRIDDIKDLLPKPTPPYPICEGLALRLANDPANEVHQRVSSSFGSLLDTRVTDLACIMILGVLTVAAAGPTHAFKHPAHTSIVSYNDIADVIAKLGTKLLSAYRL